MLTTKGCENNPTHGFHIELSWRKLKSHSARNDGLLQELFVNIVSPVVKTVVCLANSRKLGGRCIAGKTIDSKTSPMWVRPVSARADGALSPFEIRFSDGRCPQLLDIVKIPVRCVAPHYYQRENYLIGGGRWSSEAQFEGDLAHLCDKVGTLWLNGCRSGGGINDRVPLAEASKLRSSLLLIAPESVQLRVVDSFEKKSVRVRFVYQRVYYDLKVTDPVVETRYLDRPIGTETIGARPLYLCVSLGVPFDGYVYKMVASIIGLN